MPRRKRLRGYERAPSKARQRAASRPARKIFLKFRVKPLVRMPKSVMFDKLRHAVRTGEMPDDLVIAYMSYDHSIGKQFRPGDRIQGDDHEELEKFYNVLISMDKQEDFTVEQKSGKYKNPGSVRLEQPDE